MMELTAHLKLSESISGRTRERCPWVVFFHDGEEVTRLRTDEERPSLPFADGEIDHITLNDDALSRVIDEEAWLAELGRVLAQNGDLVLTLPKTGFLGWLDAMNTHRYAVDIGKRGNEPDASLPTGWNRHYSADELRELCLDADLVVESLTTINYAVSEARLITGLFWRNWVRGDRGAERELWPQLGRRDTRGGQALIGTTWSVLARKRS